MELSQHTDIRQELYLTTELRQGINILQMTAVDLAEHVKSCMEENPFLEEPDWEREALRPEARSFSKTVSSEDAFRISARGHDGSGLEDYDRDFVFDRYMVADETLEEHLLAQLRLLDLGERQMATAECIAGNLDERGYLTVTKEQVAETVGCGIDFVAEVIEVVKRLDPVGVASGDLVECLSVQLESKGLLTSAMRDFLENHLVDLGRYSPSRVAREAGVSPSALEEMLKLVRLCDPKPGGRYARSADFVWPEVIVEPLGEKGAYSVSLQDFYLPELRVSDRYRTLAAEEKGGKSGEYLKEKLKEAESLLEGIRYRSATLYKVACCVVEMQAGFLDEGPSGMRPLTMGQVARETGLSESTVSRVANGNYVQTHRGVFELRDFFQGTASSSCACEVSPSRVKNRIKELIECEEPCNPLSDQAIADRLQSEGMDVSRRTVNKYRGELGIASRSCRRLAV